MIEGDILYIRKGMVGIEFDGRPVIVEIIGKGFIRVRYERPESGDHGDWTIEEHNINHYLEKNPCNQGTFIE